MQLIGWQRDHGSDLVDDYGFFERPLARPALFNFKTRRMEVKPHGGAYSLKFTLSGRETYIFGRRRLALKPGEMLLVERGRIYASEIREETASLSLFFPDSWIAETAASLRRDEPALLEHDTPAPAAMPAVPLRISTQGAAGLARLIGCVDARDAEGAEQLALILVAEALGEARSISHLHGRLTVKRPGTREELMTRLRRAHNRIVDQAGLGVDLDDLSRTACLSRFHFLRLFRQVYGLTPLRFAAKIRLQRAMDLAARRDMAGALAAGGFRTVAAFRRAWKRASVP